jgi:DNA-binding winged helix-turn-helix (wHTH) protein/tetratricopeptide (TPR) repeat protein
MLLLLLEKEGEVVTKEELRDRLWGSKTFVEVDQNLYVIVARLRELLGDNAVRPCFIKTISGRGYRFIGAVTRVRSLNAPIAGSASPTDKSAETSSPDTASPAIPENRQTVESVQLVPAELSNASAHLPSTRRIAINSAVLWISLGALLAACLVGIFLYVSSSRRIYNPQQRILVGNFENETRQPDLDQTLAFLVQLKLQESPYLELISDRRSIQLKRDPAFATREGELHACASLGGHLLLRGRLLPFADGYRVQLQALRCPDGKLLTSQQADADSEASLLTAVDLATEKMRRRLGEPDASLQQFNMPLTQSTTTSLAALKEFTEGEKKVKAGDGPGAVANYKLAVDLDPRFALGYARLGTISLNAQGPAAAAQYMQKAFDLRDRTTDKERLYITAHYYSDVTGELQRSIQTYDLWTSLYPRDWGPLNNLANLYDMIGRPDKGLEYARMAIRVNPDASISTSTLAQAYLEHGDYAPLSDLCNGPAGHDNAFVAFHNICFLAALAQVSEPGMQQEITWAKGNPRESVLLGSMATAALYHGQLRAADHLFSAARANAMANNLPELAAELYLDEAIAAGQFGDMPRAMRCAHSALQLTHNNDALAYAAIALALAGSEAPALEDVDAAAQQAPNNDVVTRLELPTVKAIIALHKHHAPEAIKALDSSGPLLNYVPMKFAPAYYLGMAYLADSRLNQATESFRQIVQDRAVSPDSIYIGLAALSLGRTLHLQGDEQGAAQAYELAAHIWAKADYDFPPRKTLRQYQQESGIVH